jgi:hypothetical protein
MTQTLMPKNWRKDKLKPTISRKMEIINSRNG